jgi:hypothetical protein
MKIQPGQPAAIPVQPVKTGAQAVKNEQKTTDAKADNFTPTQNTQMLDLLHSQSETRPDALAKAQQLAADPNYPSADIVEKLAKLFVEDSQ